MWICPQSLKSSKHLMVSIGASWLVAIVSSPVASAQTVDQEVVPALFPIVQNDRYGYIDVSGRVVVDPVFEDASPFSEGLGWVKVGWGLATFATQSRWCAIDASGSPVMVPKDNGEQDYFCFSAAAVMLVDRRAPRYTGGVVFSPAVRSRALPGVGGICDGLRGPWGFSEGLQPLGINTSLRPRTTLWRFGYVDTDCNEILPSQFEDALPFSEGLAAVKMGGKWGFLNRDFELVIQPQFSSVHGPFSEGLAVVDDERGGLGVIDTSGEWVFRPEQHLFLSGNFGRMSSMGEGRDHVPVMFHHGRLLVGYSESVFLDRSGDEVSLPRQVEEIESEFYDGRALVSRGLRTIRYQSVCRDESGCYGFVDTTGELVIPFQYAEAQPFSNGLAKVLIDDKWVYIDTSGEIVWQPPPVTIIVRREPRAPVGQPNTSGDPLYPVEINGSYGFIDAIGQLVIEPQYRSASQFSDGLASIGVGGETCFIDTVGEPVLHPDHTDINPKFLCTKHISSPVFRNGFIQSEAGGGFVMDLGANNVPRCQRKNVDVLGITAIRDGFVGYRDAHSGRWGFLDLDCNVVLEPQFTLVKRFGEGRAPVQINGKWGFVNGEFDLVIQPDYLDALPFSEGLAAVLDPVTRKWGFIDTTGAYVIEARFGEPPGWGPLRFQEGRAKVAVEDDRFRGIGVAYVDKSGRVVVGPYDSAYNTLYPFNEGRAVICRSPRDPVVLVGADAGDVLFMTASCRYGYLDTDGDLVVPTQLEMAEPFVNGLAGVVRDGRFAYIRRDGSVVWEDPLVVR